MLRRDFIKIIGATSSTILIPSILNASDNKYMDEYCDNDVLDIWDGHDLNETDIRIKVLSYAILAPNPHNKQAWLIDLKEDDTFELYVDQTRLLPSTDPYHRQIHIGQGTFIESFVIAATHFGYKANVTYFPQGEYDNILVENKAIASITLEKDISIKKDKLFDSILKRHSNKREYDDKTISLDKLENLEYKINDTNNGEYKLQFENNENMISKYRKTSIAAMKIESENINANLETIDMFRFNDDEIEKYKDGFGLAQSGRSYLSRFFIEKLFISREKALTNPLDFGKNAVEMIEKQVNSTKTFGTLITTSNTRLDQVKIGRVYARLNLLVTSMNLVMHPISQVLQEYPDMKELHTGFLSLTKTNKNETIQMLFRLGYAKSTEHSPRRDINDIVISNKDKYQES
jgi:hypothetical protein